MKKTALSSVLFLCALLLLAATASAATRVPGVAPTDWFMYADVFFNWYSNDPNATIPWYLRDFNETQWLMVTITDVQGTNVTAHQVQHFKNGTDKQSDGYIDVDTGNGVNLTQWIIAADLNPNDTLYTTGWYANWKINETIPRTYPDGPRQTNHINITMSGSIGNATIRFSQNLYWDRPAGVMTEGSFDYLNQTEVYLTTMSYGLRITDSNVWTIPEFPTWTPILILLVTITSAAAIHKQKLRKKQTS